MGSSNMGIMTIGDIEAQQHYPKWFVDHKYMLRPNQEDEMVRLGFDILKVPEHSRQPPSAFSPQGWRFGLHNRENLENRGSEALKLTTAVQYGLVGEKWDRFCHAIVDDPRAMFLCYGLKDGMNSWTNEQIQHVLALDALFLAIYIDISIPTNERRLWGWNTLFGSRFHENDVFQTRFRMWMSIMPHDLRLVENQIPLIFIDKVVEYMSYFVASEISEGNEPLTGDLQYQQKCIEYVVENVANAFMDTSHKAFKIDYSTLLMRKHIFLELHIMPFVDPKV